MRFEAAVALVDGTLWKELKKSRALKLGVLEDDNNRWGCVCVCIYTLNALL
jgi:hypothetical protein